VIRLALVVVLLAVMAGAVHAATGDIGYQDRSFNGTGTPTGTKRAESLLWWNDGSWWADMWDSVSQDFHIFRLDLGTQAWIDSGVTIEPRANTHADVLWDGAHLYVASHLFVADETAAVAGFPSYLYRFSYDPIAKTYSLDTGFPVAINNEKTETLVIDKDSTGKVWATWQQGNQIYVNRTVGDDRTWGTPFVLPVAGTNVTVDDNSAVIAFAGNKIGLLWSNQTTANDAMYFAVHDDGQPDATWSASRTAIQGPGTADDHINLKSLQSDASGRVFAAVKTSFTTSAAPLVMLLVREPTTGDWSSSPIATVAACPNRPIVLIDSENRVLHAFYTAPGPPTFSCNSSGGAIYEKTSPLDTIAFPTGSGTPVIQDADSPFVHNVSSTKQNVSSGTGIALLAINGQTGFYWHQFAAIQPAGTAAPPTADFSGSPTSGTAPLAVGFRDLSSGSPTGWAWDFGDGGTSALQNPSHTYAAAGSYTVSLTATNASGASTATKVDYIAVSAAAPDFTVAASPSSQTVVRGNSVGYTVTITPSNGFSGFVELSISGLPPDASGVFVPNPVTVAGQTAAALSVATTTSTKTGNYTLTIGAVGGGLTRTTTLTLLVKRK
jgi:PKD repeat protein